MADDATGHRADIEVLITGDVAPKRGVSRDIETISEGARDRLPTGKKATPCWHHPRFRQCRRAQDDLGLRPREWKFPGYLSGPKRQEMAAEAGLKRVGPGRPARLAAADKGEGQNHGGEDPPQGAR